MFITGNLFADPQTVNSCTVAMEKLPFSPARLSIYPDGKNKRVNVLCDFETDGGGWTVIQKRTSGPKQEFNKTWDEYSKGFGTPDGNFWLGLDNIHALTKNGDQELRIELEDFEGDKRYAKYSRFSVSDASDFYRLTISGFSGDSTAGDSMTIVASYTSNGMRFSTRDKDNDNNSRYNCAASYGAWWVSENITQNKSFFNPKLTHSKKHTANHEHLKIIKKDKK